MNFKGGIIIIGSLIWDTTPIREKWRRAAFKSIDKKVKIPAKIRYGRESTSRANTYSMILSNHPSTKYGQALILELADSIKNFKALQTQAFALAAAEGICDDLSKPTLTKKWGAIGILFNPNIDKKDTMNASFIKDKWKQLYSVQKIQVNPEEYVLDQGENPVITRDGFLTIDWVSEMNDFDFLLVTTTRPNTDRILSAVEIGTRMNEKKYWTYFDKNRENEIYTFQDQEIERYRSKG